MTEREQILYNYIEHYIKILENTPVEKIDFIFVLKEIQNKIQHYEHNRHPKGI